MVRLPVLRIISFSIIRVPHSFLGVPPLDRRGRQEYEWTLAESPRCRLYNPCKSWLGHEADPLMGRCEGAVTWSPLDEGDLCLCQAYTEYRHYGGRQLAGSVWFGSHVLVRHSWLKVIIALRDLGDIGTGPEVESFSNYLRQAVVASEGHHGVANVIFGRLALFMLRFLMPNVLG
ncbi:hypothetical protein L3X38_037938 [Prunus dulcis]|uniref:Uncharacterized protein n=1 Tax=Prunus dulcis TaxID=3755 RepID=A0AAD4V4A8_PRUDU|nr:hypothetical protein L3X38_037938 [Prunus dulcis]